MKLQKHLEQKDRRLEVLGILMILFCGSLATPNLSWGLSLDEYLRQVETKNQGIEASRLHEKAAENADAQASLLTAPQVFANGQSVRDKSPTLLGELQGTERQSQTIQTGLQAQTDFGLQGRLYFSHDQQKTLGSSFIQPGQEQIDLQSYNLELKLPLWQNSFGRDTQLQKSSITAQAQAELAQSIFENRSTLQAAEAAFYKLSRLQEEQGVLKRLVEQGEKLVSFARSKVGSRLLERSNLTEASAALASRELELQAKTIEYEDALREFNAIREFALDTAVSLEPIGNQLRNTRITAVQDSLTRLDLKVQEKVIEAEKLSLKRSQEALKPKLDLSTKLSSFTKQSDLTDTRRCIDANACSQVVVGLNFEMPLDFSNVEKAKESASYRIQAREVSLKRARLESDSQLERLKKNLELLDSQIKASERLLSSQKDRLKEERNRQRLGRGSTFDVIRAEQDFSQSELSLIQSQAAKLEVLSQLKLFVAREESK